EIPDSVTKIDDCAFRGCTSLERVIVPESVKELGWGIFDGCERTVTVFCEAGSVIEEYCKKNKIHVESFSEKDKY
ncbi:MAG: leucine-rich repeat protein, partial [Clostridia bacterium]|nr:leucine-rich repeat protein [Clostridia bacterium]